MPDKRITVMGSFVADLAFRTRELPVWGQTMMGSEFRLGPGGKGSNQAVAAARLGAKVSFISKLVRDPFGDLARNTYKAEGIDARFCFETTEHATGAASSTDEGRECDRRRPRRRLSADAGQDAPRRHPRIGDLHDAARGSSRRRARPLPGPPLFRADVFTQRPRPTPDRIYPLCDYLTPNRRSRRADRLPAATLRDAERAADNFSRAASQVIVTLGAEGRS
jgi:ribokinase